MRIRTEEALKNVSSVATLKATLMKLIAEQKNLFANANPMHQALIEFENNINHEHSIEYSCNILKDFCKAFLSSCSLTLSYSVSNVERTIQSILKDGTLAKYLAEDTSRAQTKAQSIIKKFQDKLSEFKIEPQEITSAGMRKKIATLISDYIEYLHAKFENGFKLDPDHLKFLKDLDQYREDVLSGKRPLEELYKVVIPGDTTSKEYQTVRDIIDTFTFNATKMNKTQYELAKKIDEHHATLIKAVDYFSTDRLTHPTVPKDEKEAYDFWQATETLLDFLVQYKKYKREQSSKNFNCYHLKVSAKETSEGKNEVASTANQHNEDINKIQQFIEARIKLLENMTPPQNDRFQLIINNGSHCTAVDILLSNQTGTVQKQCFIMDAAQEIRALETTDIFTKLGFEKYIAGLPGERIQHDSTSCPIFAMVLLGKSSTEENLFKQLDMIRQSKHRPSAIADTRSEHIIAWQELPARYIKYAQSDKFLANYTTQMSLKEKSTPVNKKGATLETFRKAHVQDYTYQAPTWGGLFQETRVKTQNIAVTHKILSYAAEAYEIAHTNSPSALWNMSQGLADPNFHLPKADTAKSASTPTSTTQAPKL